MKKRLIVLILIISVFVSCFAACNVGKYTVRYETDGNGTILGQAEQTLKAGGKTSDVVAIPNEGYQFVKWSDNRTSYMRTDVINNEDLTYTAYFKKCKYSVSYRTYEFLNNGFIEGDTEQTVEFGGNATTVTAIPATGYRFVKWSDNNSPDPVRTDTNITKHLSATALFERESYDKFTLSYLTDGNGTIEGKTTQQVLMGLDATQVKAIANDGYEFVQWSDGVTTAERQDLCITESNTVTAEFKCVYATYKLDYKLGEAETDITEFTFDYYDFETVEFPVPTREHFTFGGWYVGETQVTDTSGNMIIGNEILQSAEKEIYAKWTANENYTYKILMVYVTELDATITSIKGKGDFDVYYKMSEFDIEICKTVTKQMSNYLNDMLDGLVTFEIDEYFTTVPVGSDSIRYGNKVNSIYARDIPEISNLGIDTNYQSIMTTFCMNDYDYEFRDCSGIAMKKYGCVYLESVYRGNLINNQPLEDILDINYYKWNSTIEPFIHEFIHTIELQISAYSYHLVFSEYQKKGNNDLDLSVEKLYLLNLALVEAGQVGIPIEFWAGELGL